MKTGRQDAINALDGLDLGVRIDLKQVVIVDGRLERHPALFIGGRGRVAIGYYANCGRACSSASTKKYSPHMTDSSTPSSLWRWYTPPFKMPSHFLSFL